MLQGHSTAAPLVRKMPARRRALKQPERDSLAPAKARTDALASRFNYKSLDEDGRITAAPEPTAQTLRRGRNEAHERTIPSPLGQLL